MDQEFRQICVGICQFKTSINMRLCTAHETRVQRLRIGLQGSKERLMNVIKARYITLAIHAIQHLLEPMREHP